VIETIPNHNRDRAFLVELAFSEYTSICPLTGAPDYGTIVIRYVPDDRLLEMKALRDYLTGFRSREVFMEDVTNEILDATVASASPAWAEVDASFNARGATALRVVARHGTRPAGV
jgi:7-cyano-7-deazaguanine reductase